MTGPGTGGLRLSLVTASTDLASRSKIVVTFVSCLVRSTLLQLAPAHKSEMKSRCSLLLVLLPVFAWMAAVSVVEAKKKKADGAQPAVGGGSSLKSDEKVAVAPSVDLIEENPEFEPDFDDTDDDDSDDDSGGDDDDDEDDDKATKAMLATALKKSRKKTKKAIALVKENRGNIVLAVALFAFRREILKVLNQVLTRTAPRNKFTAVLKLLLFVDFMRRLQMGIFSSSEPSDNDRSSVLLSLFTQGIPVLGALLSKMMRMSIYNPAYVPPINQHYAFERINEIYVKDGMALQKSIHSKHEGFKWPDSSSSFSSKMSRSPSRFADAASNTTANANVTVSTHNETVIILDWTSLDTSLSAMDVIRDQVSFLMSEYRRLAMQVEPGGGNASILPDLLEVVVLLESPGGSAADYGLAGQHLLRLRNAPGVTLTICVDKVAASGGYLLACTASPGQLLAAPFSVVGSVGVIGQIVNIQDLLEGWGVKPLVFRGGKDKAPLGMIGEITEEGKAKTQEMIDATHKAFRKHVLDARPVLNQHKDEIGDGDVWLGSDALKLCLVDQIKTSDEYIGEKIEKGARVLKMVRHIRSSGFLFGGRSGSYAGFSAQQEYALSVPSNMGKLINGWVNKATEAVVFNPRVPPRVKSLTSKFS